MMDLIWFYWTAEFKPHWSSFITLIDKCWRAETFWTLNCSFLLPSLTGSLIRPFSCGWIPRGNKLLASSHCLASEELRNYWKVEIVKALQLNALITFTTNFLMRKCYMQGFGNAKPLKYRVRSCIHPFITYLPTFIVMWHVPTWLVKVEKIEWTKAHSFSSVGEQWLVLLSACSGRFFIKLYFSLHLAEGETCHFSPGSADRCGARAPPTLRGLETCFLTWLRKKRFKSFFS